MSELTLDLSSVPLRPMGKREIQLLEAALLVGSLFSEELRGLLSDPVERTTWLDSLAAAAAAVARYKAGMPLSKIAEELGRSEVTISAYINGKRKAGKIVLETYEKLKSGELKLRLAAPQAAPEAEELKSRLAKLEEELKRAQEELAACRDRERRAAEALDAVRQRLAALEEARALIEKALSAEGR